MKKKYFLILFFISLAANSQIINIPDEYFKMILTVQSTVYGWAKDINGQTMIVDVNNDGEIEVSEAVAVYSLYTSHSASDLTGIEYFINLRSLRCDTGSLSTLNVTTLTHLQVLNCENNNLTSLDITGLSELTTLYCYANELTELDLTGCTSLYRLWCFDNQLPSIEVSLLSNLNDFRCYNNQLVSLDVSGLNNLRRLECDRNDLTSLNLNGSNNVDWLHCFRNQLSNLDISNLHQLTKLSIGYNPISTISLPSPSALETFELGGTNFTAMDFSQFPALHYVVCPECPLTTIDVSNNLDFYEVVCQNSPALESVFMKNGRGNGFYAQDCPNLSYVCADQIDIDYMGDITNTYLASININSYCSFTPGGDFYTIQGEARYDESGNGCDAADALFPNLKYDITNGTINGTVISNETGNYSIPVQAGTHTMTPVLEHPGYFSISPNEVTVEFPTETSPSTHNFCISPNGIHNDLEIVIIPTTGARPGFDASYKMLVKNNGTQSQSVTVDFEFDAAILDFVSSNTVLANQSSGLLEWNFANLHPFGTQEILVTLNLNSPSESPAVNSGEVINYTASVNGLTDETSEDNTAVLRQMVTNSFDPNSKICLEGLTIGPDQVGGYVHYTIYFENSGTANAENIVVKDLIDVTKYDVRSLITLDGSHSFTTQITDNRVEFIFEHINLPFDDAHNDGYVTFKIKTLPGLALDSSFSNLANIYFDYNLPIVTDAAITTVTALANHDFEFENAIRLYPNPAKNLLFVDVNDGILIQGITIYNTLGQMILAVANPNEALGIDVSGLNTGTYFVKVNSDKGISTTKFIKE